MHWLLIGNVRQTVNYILIYFTCSVQHFSLSSLLFRATTIEWRNYCSALVSLCFIFLITSEIFKYFFFPFVSYLCCSVFFHAILYTTNESFAQLNANAIDIHVNEHSETDKKIHFHTEYFSIRFIIDIETIGMLITKVHKNKLQKHDCCRLQFNH